MLSIVEGRVLGCLLEKERTVPDQYPLTLNVLVAACNQSTAREPVMHVADHDVEGAIVSMKAEGLVRMVHPSHGRSVTRYRQVVDEKLQLEPALTALLALLLLRGAQTSGELHGRSGRMYDFGSNTDVDRWLTDLSERGLAERLERRPGQKEQRWRQLLAEEVVPDASRSNWADPLSGCGEESPSTGASLRDRVADLEQRVVRLEAALADLL